MFTLSGPAASFSPTLEGNYQVALSVTDKDGGRGSASATVTMSPTLVELAGSGLHVADLMPGGKADDLRVSFDNGSGEVVITDPQHMLAVTVPGASGGGTHTVRVPRTAFTGSLTLDTSAGNDSVQLQMVPLAARVIAGDGDDTILVLSTSAPLTIDGGAGADAIAVGSTQAGNNGDLDAIAGPITIVGGANPAGRGDTLYVNDRSESAQVGYLITPASITHQASPGNPANTRSFAGISYDGTIESVRVDGSDQAVVFDVQPSLQTAFYIDGNLPQLGKVPTDDGNYLQLDTRTTGTAGRKLALSGRGAGQWNFTSGHQPVSFEGISKFNHVGIVAVGADEGSASQPLVRIYDAETNAWKFDFLAYETSYRGGVRVATADVDLDGIPDVVVAPGRNRAPDIKVFSGLTGTELTALRLPAAQTYGTSFVAGLNVAVGDVNGDGCPDIVTAPSLDAALVKVFENQVLAGGTWNASRSFDAFADYSSYTGGASVAVADLDGQLDGKRRADIIVASGAGMPGLVRVFDVTVPSASYTAIRQIADPDPDFRGGLSVTAGDVNGDGLPDIVTGAGPLGNSWVRVYNGRSDAGNVPLQSFQAFPESSRQPERGGPRAGAGL